MSAAPPDPGSRAGLGQAVVRLRSARLSAEDWDQVVALSDRAATALADDRPAELDEVAPALANVAFRSQVHRQLGAGRRTAPVVVPARHTPVLPAVGAVCGGLLIALGWMLGGGVVLAGTVVLAVAVMVVAVAGTASASRRGGDRAQSPTAASDPSVSPPPPAADAALARLAAMLQFDDR